MRLKKRKEKNDDVTQMKTQNKLVIAGHVVKSKHSIILWPVSADFYVRLATTTVLNSNIIVMVPVLSSNLRYQHCGAALAIFSYRLHRHLV